MSSKVAKLDFGGNIEETRGDSKQELSKIEKVEARLAGLESGERRSNPEKEYELCKKEEKLRQKLRYLQFFAEYQVSPVSSTFCCSYCKDVEVIRKVISYPGCDKAKVSGFCSHYKSHKKVTSEKIKERKCDDPEQHKKEWEEKEKGRQEIRNEIRKQFTKEEFGDRSKEGGNIAKIPAQDFTLSVAKAKQTLSSPSLSNVDSPPPNVTPTNTLSPAPSKLLHGSSCKTCVRMEKLSVSVHPHPPNY